MRVEVVSACVHTVLVRLLPRTGEKCVMGTLGPVVVQVRTFVGEEKALGVGVVEERRREDSRMVV